VLVSAGDDPRKGRLRIILKHLVEVNVYEDEPVWAMALTIGWGAVAGVGFGLLALAEKDRVRVRTVLVADASRRTNAVNAYVSGFGPTRRIVVFDTLLREAAPDEVGSVVAHELAHAKHNDVLTGTVLGALGAAASVIAVYLVGSVPGLLDRAGVTDIGRPRAVARAAAVATVVGLVTGPLQRLVSRTVEARADTHALVLTGDPATFERMQARLSATNLADPDPNPVEFALFATHPSTVQRMAAAIAFARAHPAVPEGSTTG